MIVFGVTQGMQPILGFNYGARQWSRVKSTLRIGILLGLGVTTAGWLVTELLPDTVTALFTTDPTLIEIARTGFRIYFIAFPVVGAQIVIQNYFQSVGHPKISIFLSLTRQLIFLIPLLLILPRYSGHRGCVGFHDRLRHPCRDSGHSDCDNKHTPRKHQDGRHYCLTLYYRIMNLRTNPQTAATPGMLKAAVAREAGVKPGDIESVTIRRRSIDARQRNIMVNLTLDVKIAGRPCEAAPSPSPLPMPTLPPDAPEAVVVGAGPAGLLPLPP